MLGLRKGEVVLCEHQIQWEENAKEAISKLKEMLGNIAIDIQHIGSTSICNIKAKPIIDIAVGVKTFEEVLAFSPVLENNGFFFRGYEGKERQPVYQCGDYSRDTNDMHFITHYIHIVKIDSEQWRNYINLRDYMNSHASAAKAYEIEKLKALNKDNVSLHNYHKNKQEYVVRMIEIANLWDSLGRE